MGTRRRLSGLAAIRPLRSPQHDPYHEVAPEDQGDDLRLGRRVSVVVAGEVPSPPPAVGKSVLAVVLGAQDFVQAEEEEDQKDAGRQAEGGHPGRDEEKT